MYPRIILLKRGVRNLHRLPARVLTACPCGVYPLDVMPNEREPPVSDASQALEVDFPEASVPNLQDPSLYPYPARLTPPQMRELTASNLALVLVALFGLYMAALLAIGAYALHSGVGLDSTQPDSGDYQATSSENMPNTRALLAIYESLVEALGKGGNLLFGPILGFVLGFYFSQRSSSKGTG